MSALKIPATCTSNAVFQSIPIGSHVILPQDVYHGVRRLIAEQFQDRGIEATAVDMTSLDSIENAIRSNTVMIWVETPSNPLSQITDLAGVGLIAKKSDLIFVVDGTWTTPLLQRPFEFSADLVVHSLTKYLGGHSDTLGGAVIAREDSEHFERLSDYQQQSGAVLDPFSSWLTLRGIRTLGVRLSHQCSSAKHVAAFLESRPEVRAVHYPGLPSHPGHQLAANDCLHHPSTGYDHAVTKALHICHLADIRRRQDSPQHKEPISCVSDAKK